MRPRVFPAEDDEAASGLGSDASIASMRPRVFPAEDGTATTRRNPGGAGFNEAAGIPRGRPRGGNCTTRPAAALQ